MCAFACMCVHLYIHSSASLLGTPCSYQAGPFLPLELPFKMLCDTVHYPAESRSEDGYTVVMDSCFHVVTPNSDPTIGLLQLKSRLIRAGNLVSHLLLLFW